MIIGSSSYPIFSFENIRCSVSETSCNCKEGNFWNSNAETSCECNKENSFDCWKENSWDVIEEASSFV